MKVSNFPTCQMASQALALVRLPTALCRVRLSLQALAKTPLKKIQLSSACTKVFLHSAALIMFCTVSGSALATIYYVSPAGSDANAGRAQAAPFLHIQTAINQTKPGDTVYVMTGVYTAPPALWHEAVIAIATSGTSEHPITIRKFPGQHPIISTYANAKVWDAVEITASYINSYGFEVIGNAQNVSLSQAESTAQTEDSAYESSVAAHASNPSTPIVYPGDAPTNGNCIWIQNAVHVTIEDNLVHDCSASGIAVRTSDYIQVISNEVFNTSWWTVYDTSGINIQGMLNSDSQTGYKLLILNNISHDNGNTQAYYNPLLGGGLPTDGNGIIIDNNQMTNNAQPYVGRTLIMGNIVYNNGGSGLHTNLSMHVDIFNNTAYMNNRCPIQGSTCGSLNEGQIFGAQSKDVNIYNNIMYSPEDYWTYSNWNNTDLTEGHNLLYSASGHVLIKNGYTLNSSDLIADPLFVNATALKVSSAPPGQDARAVETPMQAAHCLLLQTNSPAQGAGTATLDNGEPMLVVPTGMGSVQPSGLSIGALSASR